MLEQLKYWRKRRGYSVRELAQKSGIDASTVSLLENQRRNPHGRTVRQLATALEVEVGELYGKVLSEIKQAERREAFEQNTNEIQTSIEDQVFPRETKTVIRRKGRKRAGENFWVVDSEADMYGPFVKEEAERLKTKLGKARVYEATSKLDLWEQHQPFLVAVANGRQCW
jgi:transcriptional regulator with XRE-family HTH domain